MGHRVTLLLALLALGGACKQKKPMPEEKPAARVADDPCAAGKAEHARVLGLLKRDCHDDGECALAHVGWEACGPGIPVTLDQMETLQQVANVLSAAQRACNEPVPASCPPVAGSAACRAGQCTRVTGHVAEPPRAPAPAPPVVDEPPVENQRLTLTLTAGGAPIRNTPVSVAVKDIVMCVTAPCPPQLVRNLSVTTDGEGRVTIDVTGGNLLDLTPRGYRVREFSFRSLAPVTVEFALDK